MLSNAWLMMNVDVRSNITACHSERLARRTKQLSENTMPAVVTWRDERRKHFNLLHYKRSIFWQQCVDANRDQPHCLWKSFDEILGRGHAVPAEIDATILHRYFDKKIAEDFFFFSFFFFFADVLATDGAASPVYIPAPPGCELQFY